MAVPLLLFAFLILYVVYRYIVHPLVVSPLSRVPNAHPTAPFSSAWILWTRYVGKENVTVYNAHKRLGPMIRLGPNEISVNCVDGGIRTVSLTQHFAPSHQSFSPPPSMYKVRVQQGIAYGSFRNLPSNTALSGRTCIIFILHIKYRR